MKPEPKRPEVPAWVERLAVMSDAPFVMDSWLKSAHRTYPNMHATEFFQDERARVQRILEASLVMVAHVEGDKNELLGFIVYGMWRKTLAVHYAFVKPDARRHGVFRSLLSLANFERLPVVLTAPAQNENAMAGLMKHFLYDQRVLPLMQRGGA